MAHHGGGGIPQNESEAVEYLHKKMLFALSKISFLKLSKTVTEYEFITKYSTKLIMNVLYCIYYTDMVIYYKIQCLKIYILSNPAPRDLSASLNWLF